MAAATASERMGRLSLKELSSKSLNTGVVSDGCGEQGQARRRARRGIT
jgi:hypothetical protein